MIIIAIALFLLLPPLIHVLMVKIFNSFGILIELTPLAFVPLLSFVSLFCYFFYCFAYCCSRTTFKKAKTMIKQQLL